MSDFQERLERNTANFRSTKRFGPISVAHRQWRDTGHCSFIHGYGRTVEITFAANKLDAKGWAVGFGDLKPIKSWLESEWDHRLLVAWDDPLIPELKLLQDQGAVHLNILPKQYGPGMEQSAKMVFDHVAEWLAGHPNYVDRCWVEQVRVWEHENNSAIYSLRH